MTVGASVACGCVPPVAPELLTEPERPRADEARFGRSVLARLTPHFRIEREVAGRHPSGRRLVIDAIVRPRDARLWKNPEVALAIEFKNELRLAGLKDLNGWLAQCADYSNTYFERGRGLVYVFTCPSLVEQVENEEQRKLLAHMMGQFGIGELKNDPLRGWTFVLNGHHRIWSEAEGVVEGRRNALKRRVGSR